MVDRPGTCRVAPSGPGRSTRGRAYGGEAPRGSVDPGSGGAVHGASAELRRARLAGAAAVGAEVRGSDALIAPEGLGELRRLAIADAVGDLADGQRARG